MNLYKFLCADDAEQIICFWEAVLIGERMEGDHKIICKQYNDFYMEFKIINGVYTYHRVFRNPDLLAPYLDQIIIKLRLN